MEEERTLRVIEDWREYKENKEREEEKKKRAESSGGKEEEKSEGTGD